MPTVVFGASGREEIMPPMSAAEKELQGKRPYPFEKPFSSVLEKSAMAFEKQYLQGSMSSAFEGSFVGVAHLSTDPLRFVSPIDKEMCLEAQNGLRISEDVVDFAATNVFLVPLPYIDVMYLRPNPKKSAPKSQAMQFIIITSAMSGASSIVRDEPLPIIFNVPGGEPSKKLMESYKTWERSPTAPAKSYASCLEDIFNARVLAESKKTVQSLPDLSSKDRQHEVFSASWSQNSQFTDSTETRKKYPKGHMYLTETGMLYIGLDYKVIFLPFESIASLIVLVIKETAPIHDRRECNKKLADKPVEINLIVLATEPWHDKMFNPDGVKVPHSISFKSISLQQLATLKTYLGKHQELPNGAKLDYHFCEMLYLDYKAGALLSGMMPLRGEDDRATKGIESEKNGGTVEVKENNEQKAPEIKAGSKGTAGGKSNKKGQKVSPAKRHNNSRIVSAEKSKPEPQPRNTKKAAENVDHSRDKTSTKRGREDAKETTNKNDEWSGRLRKRGRKMSDVKTT